MKEEKFPSCGRPMRRNGKTGAGRQRWRCGSCGASSTHGNDVTARELKAFLSWLLGKGTQLDMPGQGRGFRRTAARFWPIWPMPDVVDEVHRVVFVDGIYLDRGLCVPVACTEEHVLSWYLARSESTLAWRALPRTVAPPEVVMTDGGTGFASAVAAEWPSTRVQRCTFHAFCQVRRYTTSRSKLLAGVELYGLARDLLGIETLRQADLWAERLLDWCGFWADFLDERTLVDGRRELAHERLRKARHSLVRLLSEGTLFAYLDPALTAEGPPPSTNDVVEGGVNAQLRGVLRDHRGLRADRRVKAVCWWCYMHTEAPKAAAEILAGMPTDDDVDLLRRLYSGDPAPSMDPVEWGNGLTWSEFHNSTAYSYSVE